MVPLRLTWLSAALLAALLVVLAGLAGGELASQGTTGQPPHQVPTLDARGIAFVGSEACAACHATQHEAWLGSHHRHAMEHADAASVRGDFTGATAEKGGERIVFYHDGDRFLVRRTDAAGTAQDLQVLFTFGWAPLQQYLVAGAGGRLQALDFAWDVQDGRWIDLFPDAGGAGDPLHWSGLQQNWNYMCADCHSTGLRRGYDPASDGFATTWAEVTVGCESCHGAGGAHLAWARGEALPAGPDSMGLDPAGQGLTVAFPVPEGGWRFAPGAAIAHWEGPPRGSPELALCGTCHAHRRMLTEGAAPDTPLLDAYLPSLLDQGLYRPDGRQLAEVYVLGSFLESRMAAAGVVCSDCHEPHGAALRLEGNALCAQCHQPEVFDTPDHTHHQPGTQAAACVSCHMPEDIFMQVDARRDHGFRVPSAALAAVDGVVDACAACHEQGQAWAVATAAGWWSDPRQPNPRLADAARAAALASGRAQGVGAAPALATLAADPSQPAIWRATALSLLGGNLAPSAVAELRRRLVDADPLVRLGAVRGLAGLLLADRYRLLLALARDPVKAVRLEVAGALSEVPLSQVSPQDRALLTPLFDEMLATERLFLDRPESHYNIGNFLAYQGNAAEAEAAFRAALARDPAYTPAYVNLAELLRATSGEAAGTAVLRQGLERVPDAPELHYALGLALHRQRDAAGALAELAEAWRLGKGSGDYAYAYALALNEAGRGAQALAVLRAALVLRPNDRQLLYAAVSLLAAAGQRAEALDYARHLAALEPEDPSLTALVRQLGG